MNPVSRWQRFKRWLFGWCEKHQCYEEAGIGHSTQCPACIAECDEEYYRKERDKADAARAARIQEIREGVALALRDIRAEGWHQ